MASLWLLLALLPALGGAERFSCRGRILGAYYADAKSHCKAFHVCVRVAGGGVRDFRFFCPPGTLFHQEAQTCTDWGDDDLLACPAELYDGQFDLYKIGSGFDTRKLSSNNNRDEEAEFGLQRAETGDRRLAQNSVGGASDLRAAHSSDFFSGQRDRGRDDAPVPSAPSSSRQSFRRPTSPRASPTTPQYNTTPQPSPSTNRPNYDVPSKRKLVRKRPIYVSTTLPATTFAQSTSKPRQYQEPQQNFVPRPAPEQRYVQQTTLPPNLPPQYKDEYVEVSRVAPKPSKYYSNTVSPTPFNNNAQTSPATRNPKKDGLIELYNYEAQSTPGINNQPKQQQIKLRNNFSVSPELKRPQENRNSNNNINISPNGLRGTSNGQDFSSSSRKTVSSTPAYKNYNSVSYEPEKNNFGQYNKQNYFISQSQTSTTTYTPTRADVSGNLNTVAYNTNVGFNAQPINYIDNDEDDGQYRPPAGEDDGQYRPELYERERELLTGAHSINIAASGNRLPDDQKPRAKGQTSAPRPFRPAPTPAESSTFRAPEPTFTSTSRPQTVNTQRTFDYFQTYTTTFRPTEAPVQVTQTFSTARPSTTSAPRQPPSSPPRPPSTSQPRSQTTPRTQPPPPPTSKPVQKKPSSPSFAQPANHKEDNSYDYAYYDTDPGFTEYDQIEEFGKTKVKA